MDEGPVDALDLADRLSVEVCYSDAGESILMGNVVFVPRRVRIQRLHWLIAHELGHWALREAGEDSACERSANYVAGALLLPRQAMLAQLRSGWDVARLQLENPHAPAHAIAVRVVQLRGASAAIYDQGRLRRRWGPESALEGEIAAEAFETARPVRVDDCTGAWPVFDGKHRRVVVLVAA